MRDPDAAQAITAALWRAMLERGRGTVKQTEKAIGFRADGLRGAKNCKGGLRLRHVTDAIEALGIPPSVFFNDALGGGISTTAAERFMARGAELAARNLVELPDLADDVQPDRLTEDDLARLDAARFEDPHAAADQAADVARQAARDGRRGDAVAAVARQGSALRVAEMWEAAWVCVWWAMRNAPNHKPLRADLHLRAGTVLFDFGETSDAANLAREAAIAHFECGAKAGAGRALVNRGAFLLNDDQFDEAITTLEASLVFLPTSDTSNRIAVAQNLGLAKVALGDFNGARRDADQADSLPCPSVAFAVQIKWLRAQIAVGDERYHDAIELYRSVVVGLDDLSGQSALAGAELCRTLLLAGELHQAAAEAKCLVMSAVPKGRNPVVAGAIGELYRSFQVGRVSLKFLDQMIEQIRSGLKRRAAFPRPDAPSVTTNRSE